MLSRDVVVMGLTYLATALRRKIDQRLLDIYFRELSIRGIEEEQFVSACNVVMEDEEAKWPSVGRIVKLAKGHRRRERGVAYVIDHDRSEIGPLASVLDRLERGETLEAGPFRGEPGIPPMIERLVWEDAAATSPAVPGEPYSARISRIAATAAAELEKLRASSAARTAGPEEIRPTTT
jgi:hypothetical protein